MLAPNLISQQIHVLDNATQYTVMFYKYGGYCYVFFLEKAFEGHTKFMNSIMKYACILLETYAGLH